MFLGERFRVAPEHKDERTESQRGEAGMNGTWKRVGAVLAVALGLTLVNSSSLRGQAAAAGGQDSAKQPYTLVEYNQEQACAAEKVPATQVKCLHDHVAKYPSSALLVYVYPLYVNAYNQLKNPDKVMEYADKTTALGDKVDAGTRYGVLYARALAYATLKPDAQAAGAAKAREAAQAGLKALDEVKKPDNLSEDDFKKQKLQPTILFHFTGATAAVAAKDFSAAAGEYKAILALNP